VRRPPGAETEQRFTAEADGRTAYRTGDLGRFTADGELVVVGRTDDEVKINGVRVHPAEATAAVRVHPDVADAVVVARAVPGRDGRSSRPERRALTSVAAS
jgi:acyl-coenzyme A synthetase/AMP-(fatty) acid ligase